MVGATGNDRRKVSSNIDFKDRLSIVTPPPSVASTEPSVIISDGASVPFESSDEAPECADGRDRVSPSSASRPGTRR
eukprot:CAMPEP_0197192630 /NCGR_PEP_ID=MMETSP1423-20130617/25372_1 /TAXON_ID=476441 /ORGANISM="Pseudo-nitzschia heimii, Strain UNC1101" /LENGTH=76 /DNA_ID=CAMNT_0042645551 /DNA_START=22 /DNA_END=249 /DNA_ORIENTATION=-